MGNLFSANTKITKSIPINTHSESGYYGYSKYYNLPKSRILFITNNVWNENKTFIKIYSNYDLTTPLVERTLKGEYAGGEYRLFCIFPDGSFLLREETKSGITKPSLIKMCPDTLNTISVQSWHCSFTANAVINNERFFIIKRDDDYLTSEKFEYYLIIYEWDKHTYKESKKIQLSIQPSDDESISEILSLGGNRYCCRIYENYTVQFKYLIFDIDAKTYELNEIGVIQPHAQHVDSGSGAVLPNGQLITYHQHHDNVQIWDTETLECVKEWDWIDIQKPANFQDHYINIKPLPDSTHLLVTNQNALFLFDTNNLVMKHIELTCHSRLNYGGNHHILANGQILAFVLPDGKYHDKRIQVQHIDLTEMIHYRDELSKKYTLLRYSFLNEKGLPMEVADIILSLTYKLEVGGFSTNEKSILPVFKK